MNASRTPRALAIILGFVWLVAGAAKASDPVGFHGDLLAYGLPWPDLLLRWVAVTLPWLELLLGGCLIVGRWTGTAARLGTVLGLLFVVLLVQGLVRGLDLRCGCFGRWWPRWAEHPVVALGRAAAVLVGSAWLARRHPES